MKIFTVGMPDICSGHIDFLNEYIKDIVIENNFQQVIAAAKLGELEKLCIFMDVWNVSGRVFNGMRGQGAAELIHAIDPKIPILIIDGREYDPPEEFKDAPPCFVVTGVIHEIKNKNELYLKVSDKYYGPSLFEVVDDLILKFFEGELVESDVDASCLELEFKI